MASGTSQPTTSWRRNNDAPQAQRTAEAKKAFEASLLDAGSNFDNDFQSRAKIIHANAKELDQQDKKVQKETKNLSKEADALDKFLAKQRKTMPSVESFETDIAKVEADLDMLDDLLNEMESGQTIEAGESSVTKGHAASTASGKD